MNRKDQEKLLHALLPGDEEADLRSSSLASGLKAIRRKRRSRTVQLSALAFLPLIGALLLFVDRPAIQNGWNSAANPAAQMATQSPATTRATRTTTQPIKVISDDELFALFPGRSLALIGSPGHQKLVFLDR